MAKEMRLIAENDVYSLFGANGTARLHVGDIDVLPRVEAVPVVHGRWVWKEGERPRLGDNPKFTDIMKHSFKYPFAPEEMWHCSHCGKPAVEHLVPHLIGPAGGTALDWLRKDYKPAHCPNCGAKMDQEEADHE